MRLLLDKVRETSPTVVDELKPDVIRMGELHQVLILLLQERVPLTNLTRMLEIIAQAAPAIKDPRELADRVREQMGRDILDRLRDDAGKVAVAVLDPRLEMRLRELVQEKQLVIPHDALERLISKLHEHWQACSMSGSEFTLLTDSALRRPLRQTTERAIPDLTVTAYTEVPSDLTIDFQKIIKLEDVFPDDSSEAASPLSKSQTSSAPAAASAA